MKNAQLKSKKWWFVCQFKLILVELDIFQLYFLQAVVWVVAFNQLFVNKINQMKQNKFISIFISFTNSPL